MPFSPLPLVPGDLYESAAKLSARADAALAQQRQPQARKDALGKLWDEVTGLGWPAVMVSEGSGGAGGSLQDAAALAEGLGRSAFPLPVPSLCAQVPLLLQAADGRGGQFLAGFAEGRIRPAVAIAAVHPCGSPIESSTNKGGTRLSGEFVGLDSPPDVTHCLVACRVGDVSSLIVLEPARLPVTLRFHERMDRRPTIDLILSDLELPEGAVVAQGAPVEAAVERAMATAALLVSAEAVGCMGALLEQTIHYLSGRIQFGAPLSNLQALRHRVAELYASYEHCRAMVGRVLRQAGTGEWPQRDLTLTKMRLNSASRRFAATVIQLHGGMGVSDELPASRLCKRLFMLDFEFGSAVDLEMRLLGTDKLESLAPLREP